MGHAGGGGRKIVCISVLELDGEGGKGKGRGAGRAAASSPRSLRWSGSWLVSVGIVTLPHLCLFGRSADVYDVAGDVGCLAGVA